MQVHIISHIKLTKVALDAIYSADIEFMISPLNSVKQLHSSLKMTSVVGVDSLKGIFHPLPFLLKMYALY